MKASNRPPKELWMELIDHKRLAKLMLIQNESHRGLAQAIGFRAHSYIGRLSRGQVKTVAPEVAVRIAHHFGVGVDDLFVSRSSTDSGRTVQHRRAS